MTSRSIGHRTVLWVVLWPLVSDSHLFVAGLAGGVQYVDFSGK